MEIYVIFLILSGSHDMLIMLLMRYVLEMWELGGILNDKLVAQWLERLTGHQKTSGSILVWRSEIVFLRLKLDERSSIILWL